MAEVVHFDRKPVLLVLGSNEVDGQVVHAAVLGVYIVAASLGSGHVHTDIVVVVVRIGFVVVVVEQSPLRIGFLKVNIYYFTCLNAFIIKCLCVVPSSFKLRRIQ